MVEVGATELNDAEKATLEGLLNAPEFIEPVTVFVDVFSIITLLLTKFVTYAYAPDGEKATSDGLLKPEVMDDDRRYEFMLLSVTKTQ